ncbi:MAG: hypothetical protein NZM35_06640 [Chitinophagales bacterium]|nr:hypothetical protein [Chitinophagales bacterium]
MQQKIFPHAVAVALFALLTVIYFLPYYGGKVLEQGDVTQWEGMSKEIVEWNKAHPDDPAMWTGRMFSGMPGILISYVFTGNWVSKIVRTLQIIFPEVVVFMFLMLTGFYILLLCFEVNPWLSMAGAARIRLHLILSHFTGGRPQHQSAGNEFNGSCFGWSGAYLSQKYLAGWSAHRPVSGYAD